MEGVLIERLVLLDKLFNFEVIIVILWEVNVVLEFNFKVKEGEVECLCVEL